MDRMEGHPVNSAFTCCTECMRLLIYGQTCTCGTDSNKEG